MSAKATARFAGGRGKVEEIHEYMRKNLSRVSYGQVKAYIGLSAAPQRHIIRTLRRTLPGDAKPHNGRQCSRLTC